MYGTGLSVLVINGVLVEALFALINGYEYKVISDNDCGR